ncbi:MAG: tripartite tricarboxylate transporter substrate binding protein [Serpentinimonas sp.]|jgi:tripartite-type tricarboxylate transporter receptor subunit TctC|nr:tripartite tricarboxylate transporter substrate binding protein [Serpentinimonas sp.]
MRNTLTSSLRRRAKSHPALQRPRLWLAFGLAAACLGLGLGLGSTPATAQSFPTKPVRIVVPFGPGGVGDLTARAVAGALSQQWGHNVVIDNRPGAGGVVAAESVANAEADGHTLFLMSNGTAVSAAVFQKLPFDTVKDFTPITTLGYFDIAVVVPESSPFKTLQELVAHAKAQPGRVNMGSINVGSTQNLAAELFKSAAGMDVQVVPYNGTPALMAAMRGGQLDVAVEILGPVLPHLQSKAMRVLAVTGEKRSVVLPEVPTALESGIQGFVASSWNALATPAGTPQAVVDKIQRDVGTALASPEVKKRLQDLNVEARGSTPQETAALLAADIQRWTDVVRKANIPRQ